MAKNKSTMTIIMFILLVGMTVSTIMLSQKNTELKNDPVYQKIKELEKKDNLRQKVAKLINIPKDEKAFIGEYDSKSALKDNPFFKEAKNGDKYLIFSESGKAIIYRESENKLINVGPIAIQTKQKNEKNEQSTEQQNKSNQNN